MKRSPAFTRVDLTKRVARKVGFTQHDVAKVVNAVFATITEMLTEGKRVEIRNFATFKVVKRDPRIQRNPHTGEKMTIPARHVAVFKPSRRLKDKVKAIVVDIREPAVAAKGDE